MYSKVLNKDSINSQFYNSTISMYNKKTILKTIHNAGFFSCCSIKLNDLIVFYNVYKQVPDEVDSSTQFNLYKKNKTDITYDYFKEPLDVPIVYTGPLYFHHDFQFINYNLLSLQELHPFIEKYFTPSEEIIHLQQELLSKYKIQTENCIGLYYRGTDKKSETIIGNFETYYDTLKEVLQHNKNSQIIIQTDSAPFLDFMKNRQENSIVIHENKTSYNEVGIHHEDRSNNYDAMKYFFATCLILAKCKYMICCTNNCSIWMIFYRQHTNNVYQFNKGKWIMS